VAIAAALSGDPFLIAVASGDPYLSFAVRARLAVLSEHPPERQLAALMCGGGPVITECDDAATADGERFGVWSGVDRTVRPAAAAARL
jgi:Transcription factor WhiB